MEPWNHRDEARSLSRPSELLPAKRWDGISRLSTDWDNLRRDPELWLEDGDCLIHLHAPGQSRRGPSFYVPFSTLKGTYLAQSAVTVEVNVRQPWDYAGTFLRKERYSPSINRIVRQIFIPSPENCSREAAFNWHLTTRNYFAFVCNRAIVGRSLGEALISLYARLSIWRPQHDNNLNYLIEYAEDMGYCQFAHCPDYALAMLQFAEHFFLDELWVDSFAHCVGMHEMLSISSERLGLSTSTKSLIENYANFMNIHLKSITKSLSTFLEEDLSSARLGLTSASRNHLNRFRKFLHGFYIKKFGYWPPPSVFSKSLFQSMHSDFRNLYDFLVDLDSTASLADQKLASGGICVLQNVEEFDRRNGYDSLPHPLPRLPGEIPPYRRVSSQRTLSLRFGQRVDSSEELLTLSALTMATNTEDNKVLNSPLVKAYRTFEHQLSSEKVEKLSVSDARKVRWILVYCTLQMLVSVTRAPLQVRDVDGPTYPLCFDASMLPPWRMMPETPGDFDPVSPAESLIVPDSEPDLIMKGKSVERSILPDLSIAPDCQTDNYIKHIEVRSQTWRNTLSMRDPSTQAFKELAKHAEVARKKSLKASRPKTSSHSSMGAPSRYSLLMGRRNSTFNGVDRHPSSSTDNSSRSGGSAASRPPPTRGSEFGHRPKSSSMSSIFSMPLSPLTKSLSRKSSRHFEPEKALPELPRAPPASTQHSDSLEHHEWPLPAPITEAAAPTLSKEEKGRRRRTLGATIQDFTRQQFNMPGIERPQTRARRESVYTPSLFRSVSKRETSRAEEEPDRTRSMTQSALHMFRSLSMKRL
ncbi:hypothetical protein BT63DRAFT_117179 [Microthyrium microscopicum]|uniref:DUF8004 domain-containing protein n=1 Tax=Microthyrium microscopicum TaxID=703497 RepID=A0A6A6TX12_9PEZI|nr:hypothetical protein BT63DRAFT_117179 [Microthyrium microscopicum]